MEFREPTVEITAFKNNISKQMNKLHLENNYFLNKFNQ